MLGVNKITLVGNLGKDPEIRNLENGRSRVSFSLATNESYKNKAGERVTNTEWHNIVLWTPLAEIAKKYLQKGSSVYIEGKIVTRSYDKEGDTKYITEIVGRDMIMLDNKNLQPENNKKEFESPEYEVTNSSTEMDELPF